jgi:PilZ domain-containing protein
MATTVALQALLLTADALLITSFTDMSRQLGIEARCTEDCGTISRQLNCQKYEALVLDFDTVPKAPSILGVLRAASINRNTVVFAVASNVERRELALREGAHFLLQRPIEVSAMRDTLSAAYDLMCVERRRYFRCVAELPVVLTVHNSGVRLESSTMNVSSGGMAIRTAVPLAPAATVDISLVLPDGCVIRALGIVIWDDKHGKTGLKMRYGDSEMRRKLDGWLDSQLKNIECEDSHGHGGRRPREQ